MDRFVRVVDGRVVVYENCPYRHGWIIVLQTTVEEYNKLN